jgi:hypothetical protein
MNETILLLDIGVLPNSQGSLMFNMKKELIAILLPTMNIARLYMPLTFGLRIVRVTYN